MTHRKAITVEGLPPGWTAHYERSTNANAETEHEITATHPLHGRVCVWGGGKKKDTDAALLAAVHKKLPCISVIYLDVDEVLADWIGPALRLLGHEPAHVYAHWNTLDPRPWDVFDVVPRPSTADGVTDVIDQAGADFWADLPVYPWAFDLFNLCQLTAPTILLTSSSKHASSHAGKFTWMQRVFGQGFRNYTMGSVKHRVAHPGALLIDDSPKNCDAFRAHGGHAILFPGVGNDMHALPADGRVVYVREQLRGYTFPLASDGVNVCSKAFEEHVARGGNPRTAPGFEVSMPVQPPLPCNHGVTFDSDAATGLSVAEVRERWPRLFGDCPLGCGFSGIAYASQRHFIVGDW